MTQQSWQVHKLDKQSEASLNPKPVLWDPKKSVGNPIPYTPLYNHSFNVIFTFFHVMLHYFVQFIQGNPPHRELSYRKSLEEASIPSVLSDPFRYMQLADETVDELEVKPKAQSPKVPI